MPQANKYVTGNLVTQKLEDGFTYQLMVMKVFRADGSENTVPFRTDEDVLEYLKTKPEGASPTEIGQAFGKNYAQASSWACRRLKRLVAAGKVNKINHYKYTLSGC